MCKLDFIDGLLDLQESILILERYVMKKNFDLHLIYWAMK